MKLRARAFGSALGVVIGLGYFVAILYSTFFGHGGTFAQIHSIFGYWVSRTVLGAFIGLIWGFIYGFVVGGLVAWLYNQFCRAFYKADAPK